MPEAEAIIEFDTPEGSAAESGRPPLGSLLTRSGFVTEAQLSEALAEGAATGQRLGEIVVQRRWASEDDIAKLLAEQWQLGYVPRASIFFDADALGRMSREQAQRLEALPTRVQDGHVVVAVAEPTEERLRALRAVIGEDTLVVVVPKTALDAGLRSDLLSGPRTEAAHEQREPPPQVEPAATPDPPPPAHIPEALDPELVRQPDLDRVLTALHATAAEAAALQASMGELAGRLARLVQEAAAAAGALIQAASAGNEEQAKIERLEHQLAQRTEISESLKQQLAGLTRTLENY